MMIAYISIQKWRINPPYMELVCIEKHNYFFYKQCGKITIQFNCNIKNVEIKSYITHKKSQIFEKCTPKFFRNEKEDQLILIKYFPVKI